MARCAEQPHWRNEGEAENSQRHRLGHGAPPEPAKDGYSAEPLVIPHPYRQQAERLRQSANGHRVQTIHAFQAARPTS